MESLGTALVPTLLYPVRAMKVAPEARSSEVKAVPFPLVRYQADRE